MSVGGRELRGGGLGVGVGGEQRSSRGVVSDWGRDRRGGEVAVDGEQRRNRGVGG